MENTKKVAKPRAKQKFYSTTEIDKMNAQYNIIFGERSNGKTYALLKKGLQEYVKNGSQLAYVRRWKEDITGRRASSLYSGLMANDEIRKITKGQFSGVHYFAGKFYLCNYDEHGKPVYGDNDLISFTFALSESEHDKSTSFPHIRLVMFDEFLTNKTYLSDEFVYFMNTISTIVRRRTDVKIYMLGNTVNKYAPYFNEMGLSHISKMEQGTIDLYRYGESPMRVAVEYCQTTAQKQTKASEYFAFDNPKLEMISGGAWEMGLYPHIPVKYKPKDVLLTYFIEFNGEYFQCNIINVDNNYFTYIHSKTTEIKDTEAIVYSLEHNVSPYYSRNIFKPKNKVNKNIAWFFTHDKVFYANNSIGDAVNNYLKTCMQL